MLVNGLPVRMTITTTINYFTAQVGFRTLVTASFFYLSLNVSFPKSLIGNPVKCLILLN